MTDLLIRRGTEHEPRLDMAFHITVTSKDIAVGLRGMPERCPVAVAIRRALLEQPDVQVAARAEVLVCVASDVWVGPPGDRYVFDLPYITWGFQRDFDQNLGPVEPFSFDIEYPRIADR